MANSYGQFTLWASVYHLLKSEPSCTSHKPRASYQRWLVRGDLQHEICPHAATQSYIYPAARRCTVWTTGWTRRWWCGWRGSAGWRGAAPGSAAPPPSSSSRSSQSTSSASSGTTRTTQVPITVQYSTVQYSTVQFNLQFTMAASVPGRGPAQRESEGWWWSAICCWPDPSPGTHTSSYLNISSIFYLNTKYIYAFTRQLQIIRLGLQETRLRKQRPLTEPGDTEALGQLYLRRAVEQTLE